ncbi:hypothetical protein G3573_14245 [Caulobacter sp. 17J65-9]|nr:hypothetical protein [Caulobacter sp. 17J65-9]
MLESADPDLRARAMRAAAAVPAAADLLLPLLRAGLAAHVEEPEQARLRASRAAHPELPVSARRQAILDERHPGAETPEIAQAAAFAAAHYGPQALAEVWPSVEPQVMSAVTDERVWKDHASLVAFFRLCDAAPGRLAALPAAYPQSAVVRDAAAACAARRASGAPTP